MSLPDGLASALERVRSVGVITGAGISTESGIQAYRGVGGVYDDPDAGDRLVDALTGGTLRTDPDRTWRAVADLARRAEGAAPNAAHHAIARLEDGVERFVLLTQNVDGLHRAAGSRNIIDIHGDLSRTQCMRCFAFSDPPDWHAIEGAPRCDCGGTLRPDVVLFEEMLPQRKLLAIQDELIDHAPDLILVVGTTALFEYIAMPVYAAGVGTLTVEVNPEPSAVTRAVDFYLPARAGTAVPQIVDCLLP